MRELMTAPAAGLHPDFSNRRVTMLALVDLAQFQAGKVGAMVGWPDLDPARSPPRSLFLRQFANTDAAMEHARALAAQPLGLVHIRGQQLVTNRGEIHVEGVQYADGGRFPRIDEATVRALAARLADTLPRALDSRSILQQREILPGRLAEADRPGPALADPGGWDHLKLPPGPR